jgi:cation:H+ antiporter
MTGSNRLLIGLGWPVVGLFAWWRQRKAKREGDDRAQKLGHEVQLPKARTIELAFLGVTSLYTLTLPLRTHLSLADAVILGGLYVLYVARVRRAGGDDPELVGPSAVIAEAKPWLRRSASVLMFLYSGAVLVASAEPFAKGVIAVGQGLGLSRFLAVRWLAPLASESPELLIAVLLAWRLQAPTALAALISSKLNQWTLLVGSIPVIFCISAGGMKGLPIDPVQREALFITAAQSIFALSLLADRRLTFKDAVTLLLLFTVDLVTSVVFPPELRTWSRLGLGAVYLALAIPVLIGRRRTVKETVRTGLWTKTADLTG